MEQCCYADLLIATYIILWNIPFCYTSLVTFETTTTKVHTARVPKYMWHILKYQLLQVICAHQCIHKHLVYNGIRRSVWLIWLRNSLTVLVSKSSSKLLMQGVRFHFSILHASSTCKFTAVYCMVYTHKHVVQVCVMLVTQKRQIWLKALHTVFILKGLCKLLNV